MNEVQFYDDLKIKLTETSVWPTTYLFKFIIKHDETKIYTIKDIFKNLNPEKITLKSSSKGQYTSISILVKIQLPEIVINYYKKVSKIEGVISL